MKHKLIPYYVSRLLLSAAIAAACMLDGPIPWWGGLGAGLVAFAGFLWYAHSGHYVVDTTTPLFPIRRDARGKVVRDRALVLAVIVGSLFYGGLWLLGQALSLPYAPHIVAIPAAVLAYFGATVWLLFWGKIEASE